MEREEQSGTIQPPNDIHWKHKKPDGELHEFSLGPYALVGIAALLAVIGKIFGKAFSANLATGWRHMMTLIQNRIL